MQKTSKPSIKKDRVKEGQGRQRGYGEIEREKRERDTKRDIEKRENTQREERESDNLYL